MFDKINSYYNDKLKNKSIIVKGKNIPLTVVLFVSFAVGFIISGLFPSNCIYARSKREVHYNQNGIKIIGLEKCDMAICGYVQNKNKIDYTNIIIDMNFIQNDNLLYSDKFVISKLKSKETIKIKIPSKRNFTKFELKNVYFLDDR